MVKELLVEQGFTVYEARDGQEALLLCESQPVKMDLVFTDIVMPRMDGMELAKRLSKVSPGTKIIFTSGYALDPEFQKKINQKEVRFVPKPYDITTVAEVVQEAFDE